MSKAPSAGEGESGMAYVSVEENIDVKRGATATALRVVAGEPGSASEEMTGTILTHQGPPESGSAKEQLFSAAELAFYRRLFESAPDVDLEDGRQFLAGAPAAALLAKSNLPRKALHDIWRIADARNEGRLDFASFCVACRLTAHAQGGLTNISDDLTSVEPRAPLQLGTTTTSTNATGSTPTLSPAAASVSTASQLRPSTTNLLPRTASAGVNAVDWRPTDSELSKYLQVFRATDIGSSGYLDSNAARSLFAKAGLSQTELAVIWELADQDRDSRLNVKEFCVAMHLITKCSVEGIPLPLTLPSELSNFSLPASSPAPLPASSISSGVAATSTVQSAREAVQTEQQSSASSSSSGPNARAIALSSASPRLVSPVTAPSPRGGTEQAGGASSSTAGVGASAGVFSNYVGSATSAPVSGKGVPMTSSTHLQLPVSNGESGTAAKPPLSQDTQGGDDNAAQANKTGGGMLTRAWRAEAKISNQDLSRAEIEFLEERAHLELQLRRKRDFERATTKLRHQIEDLQAHQSLKDVERAKLANRLEELDASHEFLRSQVEQVENDVLLLSELHQNNSRENIPPLTPSSNFEEFRSKALQTVRLDREMARLDSQKVEELRVKLKMMDRERKQVTQKTPPLLEKFRQIEQDRSLLMASVDAERSKLLLLREERLKLLTERCELKANEARLNEELASKPTYLQQTKAQHDLTSFSALEMPALKQWQAFGSQTPDVDWTQNFNGAPRWESFKE
ncbi:unnamed protein product [Amoebophrya sp. A25]|nr:unnamed protein product [Amoebophrya sp. A25]|eukprot:GSA25T00018954001.1